VTRARALLGGVALAAAGAAAPASSNEAIATLEALARTQAIAQLPPLGEHQRLAVGPLDARFAPEQCTAPIEAVAPLGGHPRDRITIELRCASPRWHLYVPVRVLGTTSVLLAAHSIVAGSVLGAVDFRIEQRDVQELPPGYMDEPTAALGLSASRPIASGAVITNQMLLGSRVVQHGQTVTLTADVGGLSVRMTGRALTDGLVNQRVRVQNLSSGKVVEGIARSDQVVEIISQ
jgi:flagella basal body P-ring formation protein FlgA